MTEAFDQTKALAEEMAREVMNTDIEIRSAGVIEPAYIALEGVDLAYPSGPIFDLDNLISD